MTVGAYKEILDFWFSLPVKGQWFDASPALDEEIRERFMATWQAAQHGDLYPWEQDAEGVCALVIVLDQFPLNMFRGRAESFTTEAQARQIAERAIRHGFDRVLTDEQKAFLYMPFMHSENLKDQERSVELFEKAGLIHNLSFAHHHRDIVRRFGRFPHRNEALGRHSTPQELAYLHSKDAYLG